MKRPTMLTQALVKQFSRDLDVSAERDLVVIRDRVEHEGFSFLAITLPILADSLLRGLEDGRFTCPSAFRHDKHGRLPLFLGGFFKRVFDRDGCPLPEPCPESIRALRQICNFWKKPKIPCSDDRLITAMQRFKDVERELHMLAPLIEKREDKTLDKVSKIIWSQVLPEPDPYDLLCRHGPGVTADRYGANNRHRIRSWYTRSELLYPSALHAFPSYGWACESSGYGAGIEPCEPGASEDRESASTRLEYLDVGCEPGVRVVFVPKTMTTPRVIATEPSVMQYIQQSLMSYITPRLERHKFTRDCIRFTDQRVNQSLAYQSSIDRRLATLDLKDASDRVSLALVQRIFKGTPILEYLEDARSLHATLPDGSNLILNKYASMGSALCFPVEAMVFYTIIQAAIHDHLGLQPTNASIMEITPMITIYGDDIIVPVEVVDVVVQNLETYGLKVNLSKSFTRSHFRESCGGDFFKGESVKPVYARRLLPEDGQKWQADDIAAWVSTRDQLYLSGQWDVARLLDEMLEAAIDGPLPRSTTEMGEGIYVKSLMFTTRLIWDADTHGWSQRRLVFTPKEEGDSIDGDGAACLLKSLSKRQRVVGGESLRELELTQACWIDDGVQHTYSISPETEEIEDELGALYEVPAAVRLAYLDSRAIGNDFQSVTKRGVFASKRRWVRALP